jgi:hypothetical protein
LRIAKTAFAEHGMVKLNSKGMECNGSQASQLSEDSTIVLLKGQNFLVISEQVGVTLTKFAVGSEFTLTIERQSAALKFSRHPMPDISTPWDTAILGPTPCNLLDLEAFSRAQAPFKQVRL